MHESRTETAAALPKIDSVERILSMTRAEVDDLPYGFVVLDEQGVILLYNRYESRLARLPPERVLGRSFFLEVAPCTRVEAFQGRFRAMASDPARVADRFAFRFHFLHGAQDVTVELVRVPEGAAPPGSPLAGARVLMMVQRRPVAAAGSPRAVLGLDPDTGRAEGPLGAVLPLPAGVLAPMLHRLGPEGAHEIGRALGAAIADTASLDGQRPAALELPAVAAQVAAALLDEALARAGLGRVSLDQTDRVAGGIIGCLLRPSPELPARGLALLYEGLLEAALAPLLGRDLRARCVDDGDLVSQPWRFALASPEQVDELGPRSGERPDDVAHRLGLLVDDVDPRSPAP